MFKISLARSFAVMALGSLAVAGLQADYIQIGGNTGLTSGTLGTVGTNGTAGGTSITTTVSTGTSGPKLNTYANSGFQSTYSGGTGGSVMGTGGAQLCIGSTIGSCTSQSYGTLDSNSAAHDNPNGYTAYGNTNAFFTTGIGSFGSGNVSFAMVSDSANATSGAWAMAALAGSQTQSITVPINVFGVTNAFTMLNDEYGVNNASTTSVTFTFSDLSTITFNLKNGTVIRDDFTCTGGSALSTCQAAGWGTNLDTANAYNTSGATTTNYSAAYVTAFNVWNGAYVNNGNAPYQNTSGQLNLDAQDFYLGANAGTLTLLDITITQATTGSSARDFLSAITVETPEPGSVLLVAIGIGLLAVFRRRLA